MKTKFSKRIISLFLAVLMVVTSIPMFAISASAAGEDHFLLAYFTGNDKAGTSTTDQTIRFAVSTDGLTYEKVNGGNQVIQQYIGTKNARDPYIFKGQDGYFYCIATDSDCSVGWWGNSNSMVIWRSSDLVNWTDGTIIRMSSIIGGSVYRCWAPEVLWNGSEYVVYFGLAADGYDNIETGNNTHMYYCTTTDLLDQSKYSTPKPLISNLSKDSIDGDIVECNGSYYLFYKDETNATICVIKSSSLPTSSNSAPFDGSGLVKLNAGSSIGNLEGCEVFKNNNGEYIFMADRYSSNGNFAVYNLGTDLNVIFNNASVSGGVNTYTLPSQVTHNLTTSGIGPRHGSVVKITADQYSALKSASTFTTEAPADTSASAPSVPTDRESEPENQSGFDSNLIARYFVTSDVTADVKNSDNQFPLSAAGSGASWSSGSFNGLGAAYFTSDNYMYTGSVASMLSNTTASQGITFSFYGLPESYDAQGRYFEMNSNGTKGSVVWESTGNYISTKATLDGAETVEVETVNNNNFNWDSGRWSGTASYDATKWNQFTVTLNSTNFALYINGEQKFNISHSIAITSAIIDSFKSGGYLLLGASGYNDTTYNGYMRDFRVYNTALTADQATQLYNDYLYSSNYTYQEIKDLFTSYENKIASIASSGTVLTNLKPAYDAYVALRKGYDAYYYGGDTSINLDTLASTFETAYLRMAKWSSPTGNAQPKFEDNVNSAYYSNLLYSVQQGNYNQYEFNHSYLNTIVYHQIGYNQTVMLYDGKTTPKMPVLWFTIMQKTNSKWTTLYRAPYKAYPTTGSGESRDLGTFFLVDKWNSNGSKYEKNGNGWNYANVIGTSQYVGHNSSTFNAGQTMQRGGAGTGYSNYFPYANVLSYNNSTAFVNDDTGSYSKKYNLWWFFADEANGKSSTDTLQTVTGQVGDNCSIYVLNYKALLDAINTAIGNLPKSASAFNYKQGGLSTLFGYIDNATAYNPNTARDGASSASAVVTKFNEAITPLVNNINGASTPTDATNYQSLRDEMDKFFNGTITLDNAKYTVESIDEYTKVFNAAKTIFKHVYSVGYDQNDRAGAFATALDEILNPLMKVDLSGLHNAISSKSIFDASGNQIYTYDSWADKLSGYLKTYSDLSSVSCQYKTTNATLTDGNGGTVEYKKIGTAYQTDADNAATAVAGVTLTSVDAQDCYDSFDASVQVANTLEKDKYTNYSELEGVVKTQTDVVYRTIIAAEAETYNTFFNTNTISAGQVLKKSTTGNTDPATTTVLTTANTLTAKDFVTGFFVLDENGDPVNKFGQGNAVTKYGTVYTCRSEKDIPVAWEVQIFDESNDGRDFADTAKIKSNYYSSSVGADLPIKTESNAKVIAKPAYDTAPSSGVALRVYNANNNLIDVIYAADVTTAVNNINVQPDKPFSTFDGWNNPVEVSTGIYYVTPKFVKTNTVEITSPSGTSTVAVNSTVTVHTDDTHYGWAVKTSSGKYQIVAYTTGDYKFVALVNETYVPITFDGTNYYCEGNKLTQGNVDGFTKPAVDKIDAQSYLNSKLTQKSPFVYFQAVDNNSSKLKLYMRVTAGNYADYASRPAEDAFAFGVIINDKKFTVKARNELTGQFYCGFNTSASPYLNTAEGFVTYNYSYSGYGNLATTDTYAYAGSSVSA
ncbi:MAG: hypothetical protein PUE75_06280 [Eubacteriales bacterium]|nr:hypothetical protein [Eubacteriales bacterium]